MKRFIPMVIVPLMTFSDGLFEQWMSNWNSPTLASRSVPDVASIPFLHGADLSYVNELEDHGAVYRRSGQTTDPFALLSDSGVHLVRVRMWNDPGWTNYSTFDDVAKTIRRSKSQGLATLLVLHYSDVWADPRRQEIPAAWKQYNDSEMSRAVYDFTRDLLSRLNQRGPLPDMVQIGNETNQGMLKRVASIDWARQSLLFNAGIRVHIYLDTAAVSGAGDGPGRWPVTITGDDRPEYRVALSLTDIRGKSHIVVTFHAFAGGMWREKALTVSAQFATLGGAWPWRR